MSRAAGRTTAHMVSMKDTPTPALAEASIIMQYITKGPSQATRCLCPERASCAAANDGSYLSMYTTTNGCLTKAASNDMIIILIITLITVRHLQGA